MATGGTCEPETAIAMSTKKVKVGLPGPFLSPFQLLPEEMWKMIFELLPNFADFHSCLNAHHDWYQMYSDKRTKVLFPEVFKILLNKHTRFDPINIWRPTMLSSALTKPKVRRSQRLKPFDLNDALRCRQVCSSWNKAILGHIHDLEIPLPIFGSEEPKFDPSGFFDHLWLTLNCVQPHLDIFVSEFLAKYQDSGNSNPIFSRMLKIHEYPAYGDEIDLHGEHDAEAIVRKLCDGANRILECYGRHIWHLNIGKLHHISLTDFYTRLHQWLSLMPNLKTLRLPFDIDMTVRDGDIVRLQEMISRNPLPQMEKIEYLYVKNLPHPIFMELLQKCSGNLRTLHLDNGGDSDSYQWIMSTAEFTDYQSYFKDLELTLTMPKLRRLWINIREKRDLLALEKLWGKLDIDRAPDSSWPLETLGINFKEHTKERVALASKPIWNEWKILFRLLEKFGKTLKNLSVRLPPQGQHPEDPRRILGLTRTERLALPNLVRLRLHTFYGLPSMNFLLPLQNSLQELSITIQYWKEMTPTELKKETIQFNGWFLKLDESNIWKLFPRLGKVRFVASGCAMEIGKGKFFSYVSGKCKRPKRFRNEIENDKNVTAVTIQ